MSENKQKGLNGVFGNRAAAAAAASGAGSLASGRHVERQKRNGTFSALGRLGGSLRPAVGEDGEEHGESRGSIAAEAEKYGRNAVAASFGQAHAPASAGRTPPPVPTAEDDAAEDGSREDEFDAQYASPNAAAAYDPGSDGDEEDLDDEEEDGMAAPPVPASGRHTSGGGAGARTDLSNPTPETALITVLPQDSLERVRFSAERTDGEFIHLYAALERHLQELYDAAAIEAASDPDVTLPTVFGITSSVAGEGKTSVAMHLALMVARNTFKRVCLIDLSLGNDDISRRLGAEAEKGVMDVLEGHDYMIRTIQVEECGDLSVMPAGKAPENPVRAARSPAVPEVIAAARQMFDLIIVDMPPVTSGNALPIAAHLDRVMLVVNAGVTPRGLVNEAIEQIGRQRVLGVVLNKIKRASPGWVQRRFGYF